MTDHIAVVKGRRGKGFRSRKAKQRKRHTQPRPKEAQ